MNKNVKYPCRGCKYYNSCGSTSRIKPCEGRVTETRRKKISKNR